ncbi:MAG: hypothetical protein MJ102_08205 [Clostridia bacterium]|nr:hypothetical protein [Clostridia bacterium]
MSDTIEKRGTEIAVSAEIEGKKITDNIFLCPDGKYRWVYEYSMLKNPVILFTVFKVLLISALIVTGFVMIVNLIEGNPIFVELSDMEKTGLTVAGIALLVCILISYLVVASSKGFKYCVLFEMDEDGIIHNELPKTFKKTQVLSELTFLIGAVANRPGVAGAGLLAAAKSAQASGFSKVKRIKALKTFHTIKLDAPLSHNQIYAEPEDYGFVLEFITLRCTNAKNK